MPLVAERINKLTEAPAMVGFLFVDEDVFELVDEIDDAGRDVVRAAHDVALGADRVVDRRIQEALQAELVERRELKPRVAFGPVRIAVTGRKVSPPLFESLELLGRERGLGRLAGPLASEQPVRRVAAARLRPVHLPAARQHAAVVRPGRRRLGRVPPDPAHRRLGRNGWWRPVVGTLALLVIVLLVAQVVLAAAFAIGYLATGSDDVQGDLERLVDLDNVTPRGPGLPQPRPRLGDPGVDARHVGVPPAAARLARPPWCPGCAGGG